MYKVLYSVRGHFTNYDIHYYKVGRVCRGSNKIQTLGRAWFALQVSGIEVPRIVKARTQTARGANYKLCPLVSCTPSTILAVLLYRPRLQQQLTTWTRDSVVANEAIVRTASLKYLQASDPSLLDYARQFTALIW